MNQKIPISSSSAFPFFLPIDPLPHLHSSPKSPAERESHAASSPALAAPDRLTPPPHCSFPSTWAPTAFPFPSPPNPQIPEGRARR